MRYWSPQLSGLALFGLSVLMSQPANAFTITFDVFEGTNQIVSISSDELVAPHGGGGLHDPAPLPSDGVVAANDGLAQTTTTYDLSNSDFAFTFDQTITGLFGSAGSSHAELYIAVDEEVEYEISGSYTVVSPDGRFVYLEVELFDFNTLEEEGPLFQSGQRSFSTPNESFVVGMSDGDVSNVSVGELTGTLHPGGHYAVWVTAYVSSRASGGTTPATASGEVVFSFSQAAEVPSLSPAGVGLLCCLLGLLSWRWRLAPRSLLERLRNSSRSRTVRIH